jgi:hypothetical protein
LCILGLYCISCFICILGIYSFVVYSGSTKGDVTPLKRSKDIFRWYCLYQYKAWQWALRTETCSTL